MIKQYWWFVIGLPLVCAAACVLVLFVRQGQETRNPVEVDIIVSSQFQTVSGIAFNEAAIAQAEEPKAEIEANSMQSRMTISFIVSGLSTVENAALGTLVAERAVQKAAEFYEVNDPEIKTIPFSAEITSPIVVAEGMRSSVGYEAVAFLAGLFAALFVLMIMYMRWRPVIDTKNLQESLRLPVFVLLPASDGGSELLANIRFAAKGNHTQSICLIPLADDTAAEAVATGLIQGTKHGRKDARIEIVCCESLLKSIKVAYEAQRVDAVLLCIRQWSDSLSDAMNAVVELRLANAPLLGAVLVSQAK